MSLRLLHTSDWHLGKKLYKVSRLPEQQHFLDWLYQTIREKDVHVLLIAGDIFDTPHPPTEALELFFSFLKKLNQTQCQVHILAGNHDSGRFLETPSLLLESSTLFFHGQLRPSLDQHVHQISQGNETLSLTTLPYFRTHEILNWGHQLGFLSETEDTDLSTQILQILQVFLQQAQKANTPQLLMAHHLFGSFQAAGSEQALSLSGLESLPLSLTSGFDYVALGHIHKPQVLKKETPHVYYSGSPYPLRFSEKEQKSVAFLEVKQGVFSKELLPIPQVRQLFTLKTTLSRYKKDLERLIQFELKPIQLPALLDLTVTLQEPLFGLADEVRAFLSNQALELLSFTAEISETKTRNILPMSEKLPPLPKLFEEYYFQVYPDSKELPSAIREDFMRLLSQAQQAS